MIGTYQLFSTFDSQGSSRKKAILNINDQKSLFIASLFSRSLNEDNVDECPNK